MNESIINVKNVSKCFGEQEVLKNINISMDAGKIYGLIGRNGSGKTVLMKCICGFLTPTSGIVEIYGKDIREDESLLEKMGIIIETPGFLPEYSAYKNLKMLAMIRNRIDDEQIKEALKIVGLLPDSNKKVGKYSMGMKQRLGIAQAIMEDPDILILDEPMNGLDNQGVADMHMLLKEMRNHNKLILLASHNKEDISNLCDKVWVMDAGKLQELSV